MRLARRNERSGVQSSQHRGQHDIGEDHEIAYLVAELVSGVMLRTLVERGVPVRKLLDIAV